MKSITCTLMLFLIFLSNSATGNPFSSKINDKKAYKKSLLLDRISYKGYILYGSKKFAIVKLGAEEHILKSSDKLQDYQLITVDPHYIELKKRDRFFRVAVNAKNDF